MTISPKEEEKEEIYFVDVKPEEEDEFLRQSTGALWCEQVVSMLGESWQGMPGQPNQGQLRKFSVSQTGGQEMEQILRYK